MATIGIDLGTASSCVAVWHNRHRRAEVIPNELGKSTTPSWVYYADDVCVVGDEAKKLALTYPKNIIFDAKKLMGRSGSNIRSLNDDESNPWPFEVASADNGKPMVRVPYEHTYKEFNAEEISAAIISKMKSIAEKHLKCAVKAAVVTVPAHFDDAQRGATRDACRIAGLDLVQLVNEDTAAAVAYGVRKQKCIPVKNVLVFSLGSNAAAAKIFSIEGTSDGSLERTFKVKGASTDASLGGNRFTHGLMKLVVDSFCLVHKMDGRRIWSSVESVRRLRASCNKVKWELCNTRNGTTKVVVDPLIDHKEFHMLVERKEFEEANKHLFERCLVTVKRCLENASMVNSEIHDIILVGGSTRIPKIKQLFNDFFRRDTLCSLDIDPNETAACGAAIFAAARLGSTGSRSAPKLNLWGPDDTSMSTGILTGEEISTMRVNVNRLLSIGKNQVERVETKGQLDTSTRVIKALIEDPNIRSKLKEKGCKEGDITQGLIRVADEVSTMEKWSEENRLNERVTALDYRNNKTVLFKRLKKILLVLWEILKVALEVHAVVALFI